jgi:pimeloyl-ACP methyl ester carboxylesterase
MTEFAEVPGGKLSYEVTGEGPLVVLSAGIGDRRQVYRFLAPELAQAGYRVASVYLRGHGDSSLGWPSITRTDVAGDLIAVIRYLGGNWCRASSSSTRSLGRSRSRSARCSGTGATAGAER